ncbi:LamG-like jellyroll fold domain-containing protein [Tautonia plasticadhaerens]|uniref:DUF6797 domain-containing protein n=1 Tax=Tautonia plasticadhaerens TaxID=2527974 RepID=A0A518GZA9_9BACT|nr:LamG-like jellyroll fold domain-containing protein [Tautonia plasticadhaerens]QDV33921.1 hypothetical protein ElP_18020 [Tautonia plasticadhaerens]
MTPIALLLLLCPLAPGDDAPRLVDGRFGQALDARTGGSIAPADARLEARPITVELWARLLDRDAGAVLLSNEAPTSGTHWELVVLPGTADVAFVSPALDPPLVVAGGTLGDGRWHHVAVQLGPDRVGILVDGELLADRPVASRAVPSQRSGLAVGTRIEDRSPVWALIDDVRVSAGVREIVAPPEGPLVSDDRTIALWSFDESEAEYLARWTPGGETNQAGLPYPHRYGAYEFETDDDWIDGRWQETDKGPFLTHSIRLPGLQVGPKAMAVFLGPDRSTATLFDQERCAVVAGVADATLEIDPLRFGLLRKPVLGGGVLSYVDPSKTWRHPPEGPGAPPRPLDRSEVDYRGLRLHGDRVLLTSGILGGTVEEVGTEERLGEVVAVARHLRAEGLSTAAWLTLAELEGTPSVRVEDGVMIASATAEDGTAQAVALRVDEGASSLELRGGDVIAPIEAGAAWSGTALLWSGRVDRLDDFRGLARSKPEAPDFEALRGPGPRRWGEPIVTGGTLGEDDGQSPFVIDTISVPQANPFNALFFVSALDFFPNGDAALATAHGDVWVVRGLDAGLGRVSWQRFATGLYQPLGLKVVEGEVVVLGRDQLTRLHDEDGDGEADFYESFNHDLIIEGADHAYAMRLETDPEGNFYFLKSGGGPHGSALLKVSADGSNLSVFARGFRHPYGLGVGPEGQVTAADNEGNWVPSSKIDLVREGGFYGFLGSAGEAPDGVRPDPPLCYIPKVADNSSGGQLWYTGDRWGDYHRGGMLHLSWGRCTLLSVLQDEVGGVPQAATVRFPGLTFLSGSGEAEFSPSDGQLYVVGLNGWQTGAATDGSFQRVRYTDRPIHMPASFRAQEDGILVTFSRPIDPESASDPRRYRAERWNYRWTGTYGSFHYSAEDPDRIGHNPVPIASAEPTADGRGVFLRIEGMAHVDQFWLATDLIAGDGSPLRFDLYATIHALHPAGSGEGEVTGGR